MGTGSVLFLTVPGRSDPAKHRSQNFGVRNAITLSSDEVSLKDVFITGFGLALRLAFRAFCLCCGPTAMRLAKENLTI